ncbi:phenylalanine--tRNA ligase subunit beta [Paenalcaligenes niemegkensis]|uniref:phenylalanine--tRNA ligase subunit beta n=1 Tax=Paenalcaligenes niemegkensis TaxID=2895469 RepID=UPI001EE7BA3F|nr:phenylalanine--tRNA ligase subunit beta [Paenalcaligenes niemegkensis]MCQ9616467.1 phenylalanine--tRNA ligase subunit beta [Paenalcaligenes niemegkensis]
MLLSESWLRSFVDASLDADTLSHRLTMAGLEVEDVCTAAPAFTQVVVGHIVDVSPHPDADRLRVCKVDDGSGELLQIVCGAPNAAVGLKVPVAQVGAELPGGLAIGPVKMRGVASAGMLCSAKELGLSDENAGLLELAPDSEPGADIRTLLDLDDVVFELKMTPNRADCLSVLGVAREVSALTGAPLQQPDFSPVPVSIDDTLKVKVEAPDLCGRFVGRVIRGVNARAATPEWMKRRLERSGQRSLSALVDISNYVMLELGRPSHIFDLDKVTGELEIRWGRDGEELELLSGKVVKVDASVGVIASAGKAESLAGIMGGEDTAVTLETSNIYLESAFWWPEAIMGRARHYKFNSDASHRYERGVDFEHIVEHVERISALILEICGGDAGPVDDQKIKVPAREPVKMRLARCHRILGVGVSADEVTQIFERLGFSFEYSDGVFTVVPPSFRFDIRIEEDLIEEVARIYGFERIPDVPPRARASMRIEAESLRGPHALRAAVAALDYQEVINFSFVEERWEHDYHGNADPIRLLNPIASQLSVMRSSLIGGLLANIEHNAKHRQSRVRVFELGRVFKRDTSVPDADLSVAGVAQPTFLSGAAWGPANPEQWGVPNRAVDFFDVKRDVETLFGVQAQALRFVAVEHPALHPGRSARIEIQGSVAGYIGEVHPKWLQDFDLHGAPVVFELNTQFLSHVGLPEVLPQSRQPIVQRDLAFWVDSSTNYQQLVDTLNSTVRNHENLGIVKEIRLFDIWREHPDAKEQSMALRFWLQDPKATLDEATVEKSMQQLLQALVDAHNVRQRA